MAAVELLRGCKRGGVFFWSSGREGDLEEFVNRAGDHVRFISFLNQKKKKCNCAVVFLSCVPGCVGRCS